MIEVNGSVDVVATGVSVQFEFAEVKENIGGHVKVVESGD